MGLAWGLPVGGLRVRWIDILLGHSGQLPRAAFGNGPAHPVCRLGCLHRRHDPRRNGLSLAGRLDPALCRGPAGIAMELPQLVWHYTFPVTPQPLSFGRKWLRSSPKEVE